jgi:outer membrane protease
MRRLFIQGKHRFILAVVLFVPSLGYGQIGGIGSQYSFSFSPLFGIKYGNAKEIVYRNSKSDDYLSMLVWEMKHIFYLGGAFDFQPREPIDQKGYFVNASVQAAFPAKTGYMSDWDWAAPNNAFSNFSEHDNFTQEAWFINIAAGISLPVWDKIWLRFFATLNYMKLKWDAQDGYLWYGSYSYGSYEPWSPSSEKQSISGTVISYEQNWFIISPGISAHIPFLEYFEAGFYFQITPLIYCYDFDQHYRRDPPLTFAVSMWGGLMVEPEFKFVFSPYDWLDLSFYVSYCFIGGEVRGTTVVTDTETKTSTKRKNTGGAAYAVLDTGLSITLRY